MFPGDHSFTTLIPDLKNVDPDDAFSSVPYERGFNLLFYLETLIGEANMTKFLPLFCDKFKHKTLDSFDFIDFLNATFPEEKAKLDTIDWETWLYKPGMPPANVFNDNLLNGSKALAQVFVDAKGADPTDPADISGWNAQQQVVFLEHAQKLFTTENDEAKEDAEAQAAVRAKYQKICGALDKAYNFSSTKNSEILFRYLGLCLFAHLESAFPAVVLMATSQGRMKFTRPLYRGLFAAGETGKALAIATFTEHKSFYNAICAKMVAKDLGQ
jgi:leukotriene-A4 hydrolase